MISNCCIRTAAFAVLLANMFCCFGFHSMGHNNQSLLRTLLCEFCENSANRNQILFPDIQTNYAIGIE
jgi:hypothetical protein